MMSREEISAQARELGNIGVADSREPELTRLRAENEKLKTQLGESLKREAYLWLGSPAFQTFVKLKHGIVGDVLFALQEGEISRGRAAELLAEIAHGATEIRLPAYKGIFAEDETPVERVERAEAALEQVRQEERERCANVVEDLCLPLYDPPNNPWLSWCAHIRKIAATIREGRDA